jgi:hypothetical protein
MPILGLRRGEDVVVGRPVSKTLGLRPRANRRCSETPLSEASNEAGRWAGLLICLAGGLAGENLVRLSFVDFSLKWRGRVVFHLDLGTPNCGTRHHGTHRPFCLTSTMPNAATLLCCHVQRHHS